MTREEHSEYTRCDCCICSGADLLIRHCELEDVDVPEAVRMSIARKSIEVMVSLICATAAFTHGEVDISVEFLDKARESHDWLKQAIDSGQVAVCTPPEPQN